MNRPLKLYLDRLVSVLLNELDGMLHSVLLFGSAAYGAYEPGVSDVDVQAVVCRPLEAQDYRRLATKISHAAIPCPARKLEFVLYTQENAARPSQTPRYELNFNTGDGLDDVLRLQSSEERHWFLLDIALGIDLGVALYGPGPKEVFAAPRLDWVFDSLLESVAWHVRNEAASPNSVLNACRGLRFAETGQWGSKAAGASWVIERYPEYTVVVDAKNSRQQGEFVGKEEALDFITFAEREIRRLKEEKTADDSIQATAS
ncbi:hypothetical protein VTO42DRAFT_2597 [Malbranchea cinnamomea]